LGDSVELAMDSLMEI